MIDLKRFTKPGKYIPELSDLGEKVSVMSRDRYESNFLCNPPIIPALIEEHMTCHPKY